MSLKQIVEEHNVFAKLFREEPMDYRNLTQTQATKLYYRIDCDLSPEHLHCDGEISAAQAMKRKLVLDKAVRDLDDRDFRRPTDVYNLEYV